jgi:nitronate monooxygenase
MALDLLALHAPIVQAPLAGGPSTPALAAAVADAGGLGFLAAGYKAVDAVAKDIRELRELSAAPFGVNIFAPPAAAPDPATVAAYANSLVADGSRYGVEPGPPRHDDDGFDDKLALMERERPAVVSFTFGLPARAAVDRMHAVGCDVWVTVTSPAEAQEAADVGADGLVVQGLEAGGHRGGFTDPPQSEEFGLLVLLRLIAQTTSLTLIASGGIADGRTVAAVLCAGAAAAQIGTALMLSPEAGTSPAHRRALQEQRATALTRAFSGRRARGLVNRFMVEHEADAPVAYPDVHWVTTPIRAAAREAGDAEAINLWAGQAYALAREQPAAEIVRSLASEAQATVAALASRLNSA